MTSRFHLLTAVAEAITADHDELRTQLDALPEQSRALIWQVATKLLSFAPDSPDGQDEDDRAG